MFVGTEDQAAIAENRKPKVVDKHLNAPNAMQYVGQLPQGEVGKRKRTFALQTLRESTR